MTLVVVRTYRWQHHDVSCR